MKRSMQLLLAAGGSLFFSSPWFASTAVAATYTWVDADNQRHYGDHPPAGIKAEQVDLDNNLVSYVGEGGGETAPDGEPVTPGAGEDEQSPMAGAAAPAPGADGNDAVANVVSKEQQQDYCRQARENRQALTYEGIVRQKKVDGEMVVLGPEERQREIELADQIIKAYCHDNE